MIQDVVRTDGYWLFAKKDPRCRNETLTGQLYGWGRLSVGGKMQL